MTIEQVAIIGGGPAGLAAAIQLKRYGIGALIFERAELGGLLRNANLVENYPGFPRGISGIKLVDLFVKQVNFLNIAVIREDVQEVTHQRDYFSVTTNRKKYSASVLVIATGTKPIKIVNPPISEEIEAMVFYEVVELLGLSGRSIAIIGSGDAAFDYALNLGKKNQVTILNRGDQPKCLPLLWNRSQKLSNILYKNNTCLQQVSRGSPDGILLDCQSLAGEIQYHADYLLGAIGREACMDCLSQPILEHIQELEEQGVLYKIGDVKNGMYRQTSIAVGDGVMAAMKICHQMKE